MGAPLLQEDAGDREILVEWHPSAEPRLRCFRLPVYQQSLLMHQSSLEHVAVMP